MPQSSFDIFVATVLGCWMAASVIAQWSPRGLRFIRPFDLFRLVRRYDVFAPDPALLQVRSRAKRVAHDGAESAWVPIERYPRPTLFRSFWNPFFAGEFLFAEHCKTLAEVLPTMSPHELGRLAAYRRVRSVVLARIGHVPDREMVHFEIRLVVTAADGRESDSAAVSLVFSGRAV